jgi:carbonic anhydrase
MHVFDCQKDFISVDVILPRNVRLLPNLRELESAQAEASQLSSGGAAKRETAIADKIKKQIKNLERSPVVIHRIRPSVAIAWPTPLPPDILYG